MRYGSALETAVRFSVARSTASLLRCGGTRNERARCAAKVKERSAHGGIKCAQPLLMAAGSNKAAGKLPVVTIPSLLDTARSYGVSASCDLFCVPFGGAPAGASADSTDAIKTMLAGTARARAAKGTARARAAKAACDAAMSLRVLQNLQGQMDVGIRRSLKTPLGDGVGQLVCVFV